jgi:hypothetical protein
MMSPQSATVANIAFHKPTCHYRFVCRVAQIQELHGGQEQAVRILYLSWNGIVSL